MRLIALLSVLVGAAVLSAGLLLEPPAACWLPRLVERGFPAYCDRSPADLEALEALFESQREPIRERIAEAEARFSEQAMALSHDARIRREQALIAETPELAAVRAELQTLDRELESVRQARRLLAVPVLPIGGGLLLLGGLLFWLGRRSTPAATRSAPPSAFVRAVTRREIRETLSPDQAAFRQAQLYAREREALAELWQLRPRRCSYCEQALPLIPAGELLQVRLLKMAPADVRQPVEIPLGEGWTFVPPEAVDCPGCGHANRLSGVPGRS